MSIKAIIFGSSGMIGQAVLRECLNNDRVESVLLINRNPLNISHPKVREVIQKDLTDCSNLVSQFAAYNTCFYSLGVSAVGLNEEDYHKVTYDLAVGIAGNLINATHDMTFCYISGAGTDSTEKGNTMWARVKGKLENKLLSIPFKAAYMFRPGYIQPMKGIKSRTGWYNAIYTVTKPFYFLLKHVPSFVTDTTTLAKAMINAAADGCDKRILESREINTLGRN